MARTLSLGGKLKRMMGFMRELNDAIQNDKAFIFHKRVNDHSISWSNNAINIELILIREKFITGKDNHYKWVGVRGQEFEMDEHGINESIIRFIDDGDPFEETAKDITKTKKKKVNNETVEVETKEEVELNDVDWSMIRLALDNFEGDPLYKQLSKKVLKKLEA